MLPSKRNGKVPAWNCSHLFLQEIKLRQKFYAFAYFSKTSSFDRNTRVFAGLDFFKLILRVSRVVSGACAAVAGWASVVITVPTCQHSVSYLHFTCHLHIIKIYTRPSHNTSPHNHATEAADCPLLIAHSSGRHNCLLLFVPLLKAKKINQTGPNKIIGGPWLMT